MNGDPSYMGKEHNNGEPYAAHRNGSHNGVDLNRRNGRNGHALNGSSAGRSSSCPKCRGLVLPRLDLHLGWEPYCLNCGWTPLTVLDSHVVSEAELQSIALLRRLARTFVAMEPMEAKAGKR